MRSQNNVSVKAPAVVLSNRLCRFGWGISHRLDPNGAKPRHCVDSHWAKAVFQANNPPPRYLRVWEAAADAGMFGAWVPMKKAAQILRRHLSTESYDCWHTCHTEGLCLTKPGLPLWVALAMGRPDAEDLAVAVCGGVCEARELVLEIKLSAGAFDGATVPEYPVRGLSNLIVPIIVPGLLSSPVDGGLVPGRLSSSVDGTLVPLYQALHANIGNSWTDLCCDPSPKEPFNLMEDVR